MDTTPSTSGLSSPPKIDRFGYLKRSCKSVLIERDDIVRWRRQYLTSIKRYMSEGLKSPSGKGKHLIILHAGCEQGFVKETLLVFESKKTGDYHEDMNGTVFEQWFSEFLKKLPDCAVIVMNNASYHSRQIEKVPTTCSLKKDVQY
ncbi:uncharacterized protein LOC130453152 [Diorhabda sublineata]|uniref:uncharacterized protein LOC130453152 n=1 Tax=Diorhabda sublineata TaxID=1163346 RepID=UPI0024E17D77|nr:uncharacterized protein LOC130453152 [Diorhabda sublineata]